MSPSPLKIDLHVHTCYSRDAPTTLREAVAWAKRRGLDGIAVTDHETVAGAVRLAGNRGILVIPGVEVSSSGGHILALNVTEPVPAKLAPSETIRRIQEAGGIAVAAHPAAVYRTLGRLEAGRWFKRGSPLKLDAVEVVNSASFPFSLSTYLNRRLAARLNLPETAGSDSHIPETIGMAYTLIDADPEAEEVIEAIRRGATVPRGSGVPWSLRLKNLFRERGRGWG